MVNTGEAISVTELSKLLIKGIADKTLTGNEIMADFDNSDCCMMGLKKKGNIVMCDFEAENEEYLNFLEEEGLFNTDRCDSYDDINETFDVIEEQENDNDDIIETGEKLDMRFNENDNRFKKEGEKNEK